MRKFKIYMVGGQYGYAKWFPLPFEFTENLAEATAVWFEGGADVDTTLYGEKQGSHTHINAYDSAQELAAWNYFKNKKNVLKLGTCKGFQNLSVFQGSKMVQDMHHPYMHVIKTNDGKTLYSNSLHHQEVIVDEKITGLKEGKDYELIGHTDGKLSPFHLNGDDKDYKFPNDYKEPEILWWPKTNSFLVQGHPEHLDNNTIFVKYLQFKLIEKMKLSEFI